MGEGGDDDTIDRRIRAGLPLLKSLFSGSAVGLGVLDRDLRFVWVNSALAAMNGVAAEEHAGRHVSDVVPAVADAVMPTLRHVADSGEPFVNGEISGETAARPGEMRHWLQNLYPIRDGETVVGVGAVIVEVTEQKRAERQLQEAEQATAALLHQLEESLVPRAAIGATWRAAWRYRPSEDRMLLGGDFIGLHERPDRSLSVLIGDVAGRGAGAAGLGAMLRSAWLASVHAGVRFEQIPHLLDRVLTDHAARPGSLVTVCLSEIDASGELRLIRAGHDPPLIVTATSAGFVDGDHGPVLGLSQPAEWPVERGRLRAGEALLFYTDGLTEYRPSKGSPRVGLEGLRELVTSHELLTRRPDVALDELLVSILGEDRVNPVDDLAVVLVGPQPNGANSGIS